jgi:hypothetical protein
VSAGKAQKNCPRAVPKQPLGEMSGKRLFRTYRNSCGTLWGLGFDMRGERA